GAQARVFKCRINEVIDRGGRYNRGQGAQLVRIFCILPQGKGTRTSVVDCPN
ncbi:unnamed protein product, partial [Pylaiella littoralis]